RRVGGRDAPGERQSAECGDRSGGFEDIAAAKMGQVSYIHSARSNSASRRAHAFSAWSWSYTAASGGHQPCLVPAYTSISAGRLASAKALRSVSFPFGSR